MALESTDLFVIQSQTDSSLYKLRLDDLLREVESGAGVQFRGIADLSIAPGSNTPAISSPANGDLYIVKDDVTTINIGWTMLNGVSSASINDRVIYDATNNGWVLASINSNSQGTVTSITATSPLNSDGNAVTPVLTVDTASSSQAGVVPGIAVAADVAAGATSNPTHVVTADLLEATNQRIVDITITDIDGGAY